MNIAGLLNDYEPPMGYPKVSETVSEAPKPSEYGLPDRTAAFKAESQLDPLTTEGRILAQTRALRGETEGDNPKEAITIDNRGGGSQTKRLTGYEGDDFDNFEPHNLRYDNETRSDVEADETRPPRVDDESESDPNDKPWP